MTINRVSGDPAAARSNGAVRPGSSELDQKGESATTPPVRTDNVQISQEGRALSASQELDAERLAQIEDRLADGTYNTPDVAEKIALRLLPEIV